MYTIMLKRQARKALMKMPSNAVALIKQKLDLLRQDPYAPNNNVKKLNGIEGYRLRVGNWRVIYQIKDDQLEILVVKIGARGEVYQ